MQHPSDSARISAFLQFACPVITGLVESVLQATGRKVTRHGEGLETHFTIDTDGNEAKFYMQNLLLEIATVDRDQDPLEFDRHLVDFGYFTAKAIRLIESKMQVLFELLCQDNIDDAIKNIEKTAGRYERLRICKFDNKQSR